MHIKLLTIYMQWFIIISKGSQRRISLYVERYETIIDLFKYLFKYMSYDHLSEIRANETSRAK